MKQVMSQKLEVQSEVIIAIDPGAGGGIAIHAERKLFGAHPIGSEDETVALFKQMALAPSCVAYMEQVQGFIGKEQPGSAMFTFGNGYGFMRGALKASGIKCVLVPPQKWQGAVAPGVRGMEYNERKRALLELAKHWWPEAKLDDLTKAAGLKLADALCILRYALTAGQGLVSAADTGRSRDAFPADAKAFKRYCKAIGHGVPKGQEFMVGLNWWVEQGRPAK
jgi:hypothetical protein